MKKVLFVVDEFFPISSAPALRINSFIKYLAGLVNVEVICGTESSSYKGVKDVKYITITRPDENKFFRFIFFLILLNLKTIWHCIRHRPDIAVISIPKQEIIYCLPFLKLIKQKFVLDIRDEISFENYVQYLNKFLGRILGTFFSRIITTLNNRLLSFSIRNACYVTLPWNEFYDNMVKTYPKSKHKFIKIHNGVDMDYFPRVKPNKKQGLTIAYLGNFSEKDFLLPIFKAIAKVKNINFLLIGNGRECIKYKELSRKLGISNRCEFVGKIKHNKVSEQLSKTDVGILFRRPEIPTLMAVSVLEYMAANLPVIVNDHSELGNFVRKANAGIVVSNPSKLEPIITAISKNKKNVLGKYKNNREWVIKHVNRKIIAEDFYKKVIKKLLT